MKINLHWQILFGLIIGVAFGIIFPTTYKITDDTITEFQNKKYPPELILILQNEKKDFIETETEFLKRLKPALGPEFYAKYKKEIVFSSKYNPYLPYISWLGELFLRTLTMIIVPLVISSIISGLSNIGDGKNMGRLALKTLIYYFSSSTLAILIALFFVSVFKPGLGIDIYSAQNIDGMATTHSFKDSLMGIIPTNIFEAFTSGNLISVIFFSILFGFFMAKVNDRSRIFMSNIFNAAFEIMMQITNFIIRLMPLGLMGLTACIVADQAGDLQKLSNLFDSLGNYLLTVILALSFHAIITLPLILRFGFGTKPWKHFNAMRSALINAFLTSSSIVTLPVTMKTVNNNCGVSNKVSSFTLPLGASISMDATALYELIAVFFIAQAYGMDLSLFETIIIVATTLLSSIGTTGVPFSGLIMMTIVLSAVGLPDAGIGLIIAVDRILDMFRTTVNVWSDSCAAVIIAKSEGEELKV
jgi:Na+/H+-dicarboxylate symporter